jgi:hypothetical protein
MGAIKVFVSGGQELNSIECDIIHLLDDEMRSTMHRCTVGQDMDREGNPT